MTTDSMARTYVLPTPATGLDTHVADVVAHVMIEAFATATSSDGATAAWWSPERSSVGYLPFALRQASNSSWRSLPTLGKIPASGSPALTRSNAHMSPSSCS